MPNIEYQITYFIGTTYLSPSHCRWLRVVARLLDHADFGVESTSIRELQTLWSNVQTRDLLLEIMTVEYRAGWKVYYIETPYVVQYATPVDARLHSAAVLYYQSRVVFSRGSPAVWHWRLPAVVANMNGGVDVRGQVGTTGTVRRRASI